MPGWSPPIAVLTNLRDNHGDWHGSFDHYAASKCNIFKYQAPGDVALCADDSTEVMQRLSLMGVTPRLIAREGESAEAVKLDERLRLRIPGAHNRLNARVACAAAGQALRRDGESVEEATLMRHVSGFAGLPHRLQLVADLNGVRWFNDSKSTTPESCLLAVAAFDEAGEHGAPARIHLIAGGYDKHSDLTPVARLGPRLAGLYTVGATGPMIDAAAGSGASVPCGTIDAAVAAIAARARPGDVVLLSPACASWDQFRNYEERGERFAQLANAGVKP
jgi:UDP-N-acetylmuramoylalanine--D-glutamate ligase